VSFRPGLQGGPERKRVGAFGPACVKVFAMARGDTLNVVLTSYRGNMFCGGQGVYVVNLARALVKRGHRVTVISGPPWHQAVEGAANVFLPSENYINKSASWLSGDCPLSVFMPLNFFEYVSARAGSNPEMLAFSIRSFREIKRIHASEPVDVVHDNQGLGYGLMLVRALGPAVVATIHHPLSVDRMEDVKQAAGLYAKASRVLYYPPVMQRAVAGRLDGLLTVSGFSKELVAGAYGLDGSRVRVAHNGVDAELFRPLAGAWREPGRLLFVGSTEDRKKGIVYLLRALARLPSRFRLVIVDGRLYPGRVYAGNLVQELGLCGRVEFIEGASGDELVAEYNKAWMVIVPSLFEGFGMPALEAMACGAPVIATDAGALPEVTGESACIVPAGDVRSLMEAVLRLDADEAERKRLGRSARDRALSRFCWDACAGEVEKSYGEAISRSRRGWKLQ